jgi:hypothetical protein
MDCETLATLLACGDALSPEASAHVAVCARCSERRAIARRPAPSEALAPGRATDLPLPTVAGLRHRHRQLWIRRSAGVAAAAALALSLFFAAQPQPEPELDLLTVLHEIDEATSSGAAEPDMFAALDPLSDPDGSAWGDPSDFLLEALQVDME